MTTIKLKIEFDGTAYAGWQIQPNELSIQEIIEKNLSLLYKKKIKVLACARTDAGVHAKEFFISFKTSDNHIPLEKIPNALNSYLPDDIVAKKANKVSNNFHATFDVKKKTYTYTILNTEYRSAFNKNYYHFVKQPLNIDKIKKCANLFLGKKDFSAFCSEANKKKNCIRTITNITIKKNKPFIIIELTADGFLYNMVRIIVGTLIEAGLDKLTGKDILEIFKSKNRKNAGHTAPAKGLCLKKVYYR